MKPSIDRVAALVLIIGCLILVGFGIDGEVKSILTMAGVYLFITAWQEKRTKGQR